VRGAGRTFDGNGDEPPAPIIGYDRARLILPRKVSRPAKPSANFVWRKKCCRRELDRALDPVAMTAPATLSRLTQEELKPGGTGSAGG